MSGAARDTTASAGVTAATGGEVELAGVRIVVPKHAASGSGTLELSNYDHAPANVASIERVGAAYQVTIEGATLLSPATVAFDLPDGWDPSEHIPVVVWEDVAGRWRWLPTSFRPGQTEVVADIDHFSAGFLARIDVTEWAKARVEEATNYLTGRAGADQPACAGEDIARSEGLSVSSDGGDAVKWCAGREDGRDILRITNNRRAVAQITFPETWVVVDGGGGGFSLEAANRLFTGALLNATAAPGSDVRLLTGGDTLTVSLPPGGSGDVRVEMSILSWALSGIIFGGEVWYSVKGAVSSKLDGLGTSFADRLLSTIAQDSLDGGWLEAGRECARALTELTDRPLSTATSEVSPAVLKAMWGCVPAILQADFQESGINFFASGLIIEAGATVIGAVLTALHLIVSGLRELWDTFASFGGDDDVHYDIAMRSRAAPAFDECSPGVLRRDLGAEAHVIGDACKGGWAYVGRCLAPEGCGDHEIIARYRGDRWELVVGFPTTMCRGELAAQGAPPLILDQVNWMCEEPSGTAGTTAGDGLLRSGDSGQRVRALQGVLVARGLLSPPVDGVFGPTTEEAVKRFQSVSGLEVDGIAGPATQATLALRRDPVSALDPWTTYALIGLERSTLQLTLLQWEYAGEDVEDWIVGEEFTHSVRSDCAVYAMDGTTRTLDRLAQFIMESGGTDFPPVFQLLTDGRGHVMTIIEAA
jgi:hypothetical protein